MFSVTTECPHAFSLPFIGMAVKETKTKREAWDEKYKTEGNETYNPAFL